MAIGTVSGLQCQKEHFTLPDGEHYLNGAFMSPLLRAVEEAGIGGIRKKRFPVDIAGDHFFEDADRARQLYARLVGSDEPERVAILPSVSYGVAIAARNTAIAAGQNVVLAEGQFPSNALVWKRVARERGADVRVVPAPDRVVGRGREWNARILGAIDGDTAAVALGPVHWTDGTVFRLEEIGGRAREVGAALVVDATQSLGVMPLDVGRIGADAVITAAYKWMLGPYSISFGWLGPRYDDGQPLEETWLGRVRSDDFRSLVDHVEEYRPFAARYDVGGRSNFVLLPMAIAALHQIEEWGVERIGAYSRDLTADLFEPLRRAGFQADDDDGRAPHLFGLRAPAGLDNASIRAGLEQRRIHVSLRGAAIRVSAHVYNTEADVAALREALLEAARAPA